MSIIPFRKTCMYCMRNKASTHDYCNRCIMFLLPSNHVDSFKKEYYFLSILDEHLSGYYGIELYMGETLPGTNYIPDAFFTFDNRLFIVEIDEYSHRRYTNEHEREENILSYYDAVMIRINVDSYKSNEEGRYPSIWNKYTYFDDRMGDKYIRVNTHLKELERRKSVIICNMNDILFTVPVKSIIRFFYDD